MKLNPDKCHLLIFGKKNIDVSVQIHATSMTESAEEKLLVVTLDKQLDFESVNSLCKKVWQKLHALSRVSNYVDLEKLRIMMSAFVVSQSSYCPLVWMFHDGSVNKEIKKTHEFWESHTKIVVHIPKNYWRKQTQCPFTTKIYSGLLLKFVKLKRILLQLWWIKSLRRKILYTSVVVAKTSW